MVMTDPIIEAKHRLRWFGYILAGCWLAAVPLVDRTLGFSMPISSGQRREYNETFIAYS
jgi:hypothetical protein